MIQLHGVSRTYRRGADEVRALVDLTLEIPTGSFVGIMGPSGSGKSTLLNLIAGLDRPSSGTVTVAGQSLDGLNENQLAVWRGVHLGFVFQFYNLLPVLSAAENIELPLLLTRLSKPQRRKSVETALQIVGLAERQHHFPNQMSGGEQQRVAIARALVIDPVLLVADEPTGDLDAQNAEAVLDLLRRLKNEFHKTIVMVTHDPRSERYVDYAVRLDKGILISSQQESLFE